MFSVKIVAVLVCLFSLFVSIANVAANVFVVCLQINAEVTVCLQVQHSAAKRLQAAHLLF